MSHATLNLDGKSYDLPIFLGAGGEVGIDLSELLAKAGARAPDPGYGDLHLAGTGPEPGLLEDRDLIMV